MHCVINPWIFYIAGVATYVYRIALLCLMAALICMVYFYFEDDENDVHVHDRSKRCIAISIICALIMIFTPSKNTIIEMAVSKNITYETIEKTQVSVKELVDYIVEKVEELKNE